MRRHKGTTKCSKQKTAQAEDNPSPEDAHIPGNHHNCHKHGALHPLRGAAPVTWRCTRYVAVHPLCGGAPEQKGCNAYGSGAAPQHTRTNAELTGPIYSPPQPARARRAD